MRLKYKILVTVVIIVSVIIPSTIVGLYFYNAQQRSQKISNYFLLSQIPAEFSLKVESNGTWFGAIAMGMWNFTSGSNNTIYNGTAVYCSFDFMLTGSNSYLNLTLLMNGDIVYQNSTQIFNGHLTYNILSPMTNFFGGLFLLSQLGII